jgi:hypothetical protein
MALQIRQGTNAERQTITPASGEPIWTTDQKQLWVGDGSTVGGVSINSTSSISYDDATFKHLNVTTTSSFGGLITLGTGTYQTKFGQNTAPGYDSYFSIQAQRGGETFLVETYENVYFNTTGTVRIGDASGTGILATDNIKPTNSGVNSTLTVYQHIIPDADGTRDLGSPTRKYRRLYVTSSTIYMGDNALSINQNGNLAVNGQVTSNQGLNTTDSPTFQNLTVVGTLTGTLSTSSITGLSLVGWSNNYNDLNNKPSAFDLSTVTNQTLLTSSNVRFNDVRLTGSFTATSVVTTPPAVLLATNNSGANPTTTSSNILGVFGFGGYDGTVYTTADKYPTVQFQGQAFENWARNANGTSTNVGSAWTIGSVIRNTLYGAYNTASMMTNILLQPGNTSGANQAVANLYIGTANLSTGTFYSNAGNQFQSYPKTNVNFVNAPISLYGVSTSDTTDRDNNTLTGSDTIFITTSRRSGVSGRRNALTATDQVFLLTMSGMNSYNSTGFGATTALMKVNTVENFGATTYGSRWTIQSVNSGTTTISNRLLLDDRLHAYGADTHKFTDKSGGFTALSMTTATAVFTAIPVVPNYTAAALRAITGQVGGHAAVNDNGGQMAYWDTTNTRWSYIQTGSAV